MGLRSTKSSPANGAALPFDTVGMTILPGRPLPEWAEPAAAAAEAAALSGPELIADAPHPAAAEATPPAPLEAEPSAPDWAALAATQPAPMGQVAGSPEPAFAMAGAGMVGGALVGATAAAGQGGYGHASPTYPPEPSRYPAAPAAGLAAMAQAPTTAPAEHLAAGGTATAMYPGQTDTRTFVEPTGASAPGHVTQPAQGAQGSAMPAQVTHEEPPAPGAPSSEWKSPERTELSPEHVALLSWWADMIAAGQFPAPGPTPGTEENIPETKPRRTLSVKAAALSLVAVAAVGGAAVFGMVTGT